MARNEIYMSYYNKLKGKTIARIVNDGETSELGLFGFEFTDGTVAWILRDEEGNGPGFIEIQEGRP